MIGAAQAGDPRLTLLPRGKAEFVIPPIDEGLPAAIVKVAAAGKMPKPNGSPGQIFRRGRRRGPERRVNLTGDAKDCRISPAAAPAPQKLKNAAANKSLAAKGHPLTATPVFPSRFMLCVPPSKPSFDPCPSRRRAASAIALGSRDQGTPAGSAKPNAASASRICPGGGASTLTASLFLKSGTVIALACSCKPIAPPCP